MLRRRLVQHQKEIVPKLHIRAVDWHVQHGMINEAVGYAAPIGDDGPLFSLVESNILEQILQGEFSRAKAWLAELPKDHIWERPVLCLAKAWIDIRNLSYDAAEKLINRAYLSPSADAGEGACTRVWRFFLSPLYSRPLFLSFSIPLCANFMPSVCRMVGGKR